MTDYLELRYFNDTNTAQTSALHNDRTFPFLHKDQDYTANVVRFDCDNKLVPIYIPLCEKPHYDFAYDGSSLRSIFSPDLMYTFENAKNYSGGGSNSTHKINHNGNFDMNGDFIAMCSYYTAGEAKFGVWNHNTRLNIWWNEIISSGLLGIVDCKFSTDGTKLFVCSNFDVSSTPFHKVACYNASNGSYISQRISVANTNVRSFAVHGDICSVGCDDGNVYLYDVIANSTLATLTLDVTEPVTSLDMCLTPSNIICAGNDAGVFKIWRATSGYSYVLENTINDPAAINTLSISPDGQHVIFSNNNGGVTFLNRDGVTIYKHMEIQYISSIKWKRLDSNTSIVTSSEMKNVYRIIITFNNGDQSFVQIRNFYFSPDSWIADNFHTEELQQYAVKDFVINSMMTNNNKLTTSHINPSLPFGDHTNFTQYNTNHVAPEIWKLVVDDTRKKINTDLQIMLEYHHIPNSTSSAKIGKAKFVEYRNDDYSLVGYSGGKTAPFVINRKITLDNDFFHCYSLRHFATLLQTALNEIFKDLQPFFTANQPVTCAIIDKKLAIIFPQNAFDFDFRIIINQSLKNIIGFHSVPHEYLPNSYVIVIKKDILQNYGSSTQWVITELYRPTEMFPYKSLLFTCSELQTAGMHRYNNHVNLPNQKNDIITDLTLFPQYEENWYDTISYTPQSYNRPVNIYTTNDVNKLTINTLLETSDGYQSALKINPLHTSAMMLKFDLQ
jgi:hypothetical protein